ncbi:hypothetical protein [Burkholderia gladioli]|uniref:hypothetical protein n=1 Tax=Burkholderia gladioli TaxID=28095 RepID=UPI001FC845FC|nr:hypothetical protein [Burkholderia gladioli]
MSDNGAALGRAFAAERNAADWKSYAKKLEQQLLVAQANLAVTKCSRKSQFVNWQRLTPPIF